MTESWMTVAEAAEYSAHHAKTLLRALRRGELQGVQARANSTWRTRASYVDAWLAGRQPARKRGAA